MNNEIPLKQIIEASLSKIGSVADANTVIGEPKTLPNGVIIIPFSKVSVGFVSGGADYNGKNHSPDRISHFAGGNSAGVSVTPLGFLLIEGDQVRMLDLKHPESYNSTDPVSKVLDSVNALIDKSPSLILKIKDLLKKDKEPNIEEQVEEKVEQAFKDK